MANANAASKSRPADERLPDVKGNTIIQDMMIEYLSTVDEISTFNDKYVETEKDPDAPTPWKMLGKAKDLEREAGSRDSLRESDPEVATLLDDWDTVNAAVTDQKDRIGQYMAQRLGIELSPEKPKAPEHEVNSLKDKRTQAANKARTMAMFVQSSSDSQLNTILGEFLERHKLPEVNRRGEWAATGTSAGAYKYRVDVTASRNGEVLFTEKGFVKAAQAAAKLHGRGNKPQPQQFRTAWENAGNTPENTVQASVSFTHDGVDYAVSKRPTKS